MNKIGFLTLYNNGNYEELQGEIKTLALQLNIKLVPDNMRTNTNSPDYIIYADNGNNEDIEIGVAWKKSKPKPDGEVFEFLSLSIDDMSLPETLNVAAFKNENGGYDISWRRRKQANNLNQSAA